MILVMSKKSGLHTETSKLEFNWGGWRKFECILQD